MMICKSKFVVPLPDVLLLSSVVSFEQCWQDVMLTFDDYHLA